jgi:fumarate hydratase subunit alpha
MREIHVSAVTDAVKKLCMEANWNLEPDMLRAFDRALAVERSPAGRQVLQILQDNARLAATKRIPYCQDTGFVVCFVELGQDVHVTGGGLQDAIHEGVRQGYTEGYLRASIVRSPFDRVNTGDNTPAVVHVDVVPGATLRLLLMAKGGGCENRSKYRMLTPAEGLPGVKDFIIECVRTAGPDACPPLVLGVGVGGTFEKAALLSKRALFRELGSPKGALPGARLAEPRSGAGRARAGAAGPGQPARHRAPGLRRRHHRVRDPHPDLPVPHHLAARGGHDRVPRPPAQGGHAVSRTRARRSGGRAA